MDASNKSLFKTAKHFKVTITRKKENPIKFILSVLLRIFCSDVPKKIFFPHLIFFVQKL